MISILSKNHKAKTDYLNSFTIENNLETLDSVKYEVYKNFNDFLKKVSRKY